MIGHGFAVHGKEIRSHPDLPLFNSYKMQLTAIIEETKDGWFVGQLEEIPEVLSQGRTKEELLDNLRDALEQLFLANRAYVATQHVGKDVMRADLKVA